MKKHLFILCLFVVQLNAQSINLSKLGQVPRNYYEEIPFEFISEKILIPVTIEGETYRFILDTGAPNVISNRLFEKLGGKAIRKLNVSDANNSSSQMNVALLPEVKLGNAVFRDIPALVNLDDSNIVFGCFQIDGLLGSNMLSTSAVQFDLPNKRVILTDQRKKLNLDASTKEKLELVGKQKSPYVWIELEGEKTGRERLLVDTGAADLYDLSKAHYKLLAKQSIFKKAGTSSGASSLGLFGAGTKSVHYRLFLPTLRLAGHPFRNVVLETSDDDNSRIGATILEHGILTLDYKKKRFYFQPFRDESLMNDSVRGISLTSDGEQLLIGHVWDEQLKDRIAYGDVVLKINGEPYDVCEIILNRLEYRTVQTVRYLIQPADGGENFEIELSSHSLSEKE
jgi:predicted aspartyl protease